MLLQYLICGVLGLLLTLSFAPFNLYPMVIISIAGIYHYGLEESSSKKQVFFKTSIFGFCHYLSSLYWLAAPLFVDIKSYYFLLPLSLVVAPLVLSLFISTPAVLAHKFGGNRKDIKVLSFSALLIAAEFLRTYLIPFPWNLLGYTSDGCLPLMQCSRILTIHGLGFVIVFFSVAAFSKIRYITLLGFGIFTTCILYGFATILLYKDLGARLYNPNDADNDLLSIRIVQPNTGHFLYDDYFERGKKLYDLLDFMVKDLPMGVDLIILPEGALPFSIMGENDPIIDILKNIASTYNTNIIIAADYFLASDPNDESSNAMHYNSALLISSEGVAATYAKNILVPFGEYIPFKKLLRTVISPVVLDGEDFQPGTQKSNFVINDKKFFMSICFESIFPQFFNSTDSGYILNLTNDVWLDKTIGPYQHFSMSKFRAVESRIYVIRASNTGPSAIIDPLGRVVQGTDIFEALSLDLIVP